MDRSELLATLQAFRVTLDDDFAAPTDWSYGVQLYRSKAGEPLRRFFDDFSDVMIVACFGDISADLFWLRQELPSWPIERQKLREIIDKLLLPPVKLPNEERDKWIYEQRFKGTADKVILGQLAKKKSWEAIASIQGIRFAGNRYANANPDLPAIPARQRGRKPRRKPR